MTSSDSEYDVLVVGGGAAGLSAALVLTRAQRRVAVVDSGAPRNAPASRLHGYLSRDGTTPAELLVIGRSEVVGYGGVLVDGDVRDVVPNGRAGFRVLLHSGQRVTARRVLVATGLRDELPDVAGLRERWARDVLHCPYCHGHEVRGRRLGVLGGTAGAVRYAQIVRQWTHDLVYLTPADVLTATERNQFLARGIDVVEGAVDTVLVDDADTLTGVRLDDGRVISIDALFVPPRFVPDNRLLVAMGCELDADGFARVESSGRTSQPSVWAAGNVVDPRAQVITAAGGGSAAAIGLNADLVDEDVRHAVRDLSHGLDHRPALNVRSKENA